MTEIDLNHPELLDKVFAYDSINFLIVRSGNIGKSIHGQELVIAPYRIPNFDACSSRLCRTIPNLCWRPSPARSPKQQAVVAVRSGTMPGGSK